MLMGFVYVFFYGILFLFGTVGGLRENRKLINTYANIAILNHLIIALSFRLWSFRASMLNAFVLACNAFSWFFLLVREGQNDFAGNANWVCSAFNS
jgi:hypothetical protein